MTKRENMKKITIYYRTVNGGDGSAYPNFYTTAALADWYENNDDEGFCESTGSLDIFISEESEINIPKLKNEWICFLELINDGVSEIAGNFAENFFPEGFDKVNVKTREVGKGFEQHLYNDVYVDNKKVGEIFRNKTNSGKILENEINQFSKSK